MTLIIYCNPQNESLGFQVVEQLQHKLDQRKESFRLHSLYQESFPPVMPLEEIQRGLSLDPLVREHQESLKNTDRLVLIYPDWWGQPPAILKGWLDRVLAPEIAYSWEGEEFEEKQWVPELNGKEAEIIITADNSVDLALQQKLWDQNSLGKCGMKVTVHFLDHLHQRRDEWLKLEIQKILDLIFRNEE